jgi:hypothetical protein
MTEFRSMSAKCLDVSSDNNVVLHEVKYEVKDSGVWVVKTKQVMATDPVDAINYVKRGEA